MKKLTEKEVSEKFPSAINAIPARVKSGCNLVFNLDVDGLLSMRSDDGTIWEWSMFGRWIRTTTF